jgi:hypothetical protein
MLQAIRRILASPVQISIQEHQLIPADARPVNYRDIQELFQLQHRQRSLVSQQESELCYCQGMVKTVQRS